MLKKKKGRKTGREKIRAAIILSESRPRRCSAGTKMSAENHGKMISCFFFHPDSVSEKSRKRPRENATSVFLETEIEMKIF